MDRIQPFAGPGRGLSVLRALAAAGALLAAPGAASAGDEFEDGFKDELGRLAAHEAVGVGRGVLAQVLLSGGPGYYVEEYPVYGRGYYDDYERGYRDYYPRHQGGGGYPGYYRPYRGHPGHGWGQHRYHGRRHHYHGHHHHRGCRD